MDDIMKTAFVPSGASWRIMGAPWHEICALPAANPPGGETIISLPLGELLVLMAAHLARHPEVAQVLYEHEVRTIGQEAGKAWVQVKTPGGEKKLEADYVVGCDGGNSIIRRQLFGDSFPGFTWEKQIVATNVSESPWGLLCVCVSSVCCGNRAAGELD